MRLVNNVTTTRTAVSKYPFVGFHFRDGCDEDELGDIKWDSAGRPDECAACHRRERANVSTMYLAGHRDGYRSKEASRMFP